jgi:MFS-type transporter involved in bile tolerance (Atg22 family)
MAQTPEAVWVLFAIYGLFYGLTEGAERALIADLVASPLRGTAYGWFHFSIGVSTLPASLLMGLMWQKFGSPAAFSLGAFLALLAVTLLWSLLPKEKPA